MINTTNNQAYVNSSNMANSIHLSNREKECVEFLLLGLTVKGIARELKLSPRTVESYIKNIKTKMECHSRSQLISRVLKEFVQMKLYWK